MSTNRNQSCYRGQRAIDNCNKVSSCDRRDNHMDHFPIGMAYVPWQKFCDLYDPHQGLHRGTMFRELDFPFFGKRGKC